MVQQTKSVRAKKKPCPFCTSQKEPSFRDIVALERYVSDRGKILARKRSGVCAKHQRRVTKAIKQARYLALLPFVHRAM